MIDDDDCCGVRGGQGRTGCDLAELASSCLFVAGACVLAGTVAIIIIWSFSNA